MVTSGEWLRIVLNLDYVNKLVQNLEDKHEKNKN